MPGIRPGRQKYKMVPLNNWQRGLQSFPRLSSDLAAMNNMYVRQDGYLVNRGRLVLTNTNFGAEVPRGLWQIDPVTLGFNYVVATTSNWYKCVITSQTPPIAVTSTAIQAYAEGSHPTLVSGLDKTGKPAVFFCGYDGASTHVFQYNGAISTLAAWTNQIMLGYWNNVLFGGGGNSASGFTANIVYSAPNDPTTLPVTNLTSTPSTLSAVPVDMFVINDTPFIVMTSGIASLSGGGAQGYPPLERSSFKDQILARTAQSSGNSIFAVGAHGLYDLGDQLRDLSIPIKNFFYPVAGDINISGPSFGRGSFCSNGYFYAVILTNSTTGGTVNTTDNALLIYDLRMHNWTMFSFPAFFAPLYIAPGGFDIGQGGVFFTSFALLGKDLVNNRYSLAFLQLTNGASSVYQDLGVNNAGNATVPADYVTQITTALLDDGDTITEKTARDLIVNGASGRANVQITLSGLPNQASSSSLTQVQQWTAQQISKVLNVEGLQTPMVKYQIDIQGKGDLLIEDIAISWRPRRIGSGDYYTDNTYVFTTGSVVGGASTGWVTSFG